nr:hypothetical protein Iba_scaffold4978CG0330 [Ipomoea batatas]GME15468.1 hypothetical protein Iba_scaffold16236CG0020 [Ipomoea batatas]
MPQLEREFDGVNDPEPEEVAGLELFTKLQRLTDISGDGEVKSLILRLIREELFFLVSKEIGTEETYGLKLWLF